MFKLLTLGFGIGLVGCALQTPVAVDAFHKEFPWKKFDIPILFVRGEKKDPHEARVWEALGSELRSLGYQNVDYVHPLQRGPLRDQIHLECFTVHLDMKEVEKEIEPPYDPEQGVASTPGGVPERKHDYIETMKNPPKRIVRITEVRLKLVYWPTERTMYEVHHDFSGPVRDLDVAKVSWTLLSVLALWIRS